MLSTLRNSSTLRAVETAVFAASNASAAAAAVVAASAADSLLPPESLLLLLLLCSWASALLEPGDDLDWCPTTEAIVEAALHFPPSLPKSSAHLASLSK
jgi:hypothetical protein